MHISVPGNLLLLGEYAVLEEGGLGLALAVEKRARLTVEPAEELAVTGVIGGEPFRWTEAHPESSPLIAAVVEACRERLRSGGSGAAGRLPGAGRGGSRQFRTNILIDSSALFHKSGRKSGFGSSSAVAVGLTWALLSLTAAAVHQEGKGQGAAPQPGEPDFAQAVLAAAFAAHRRAQGGLGSGYDVYASFYGGAGLFSGGRLPTWQPCRLPWLLPLYLFWGRESVSTPASAQRYMEWKSRHPRAALRFLRKSNRNVAGFAQSASRQEAAVFFRHCRELGLKLGQQIGVAARLVPPLPIPEEQCKALGAGNELGAYLPMTSPAELYGTAARTNGVPSEPGAMEGLVASSEGLLWQA